MITDRQWDIFKQHIKPNATVRWGKWGEGYLLENFPYAVDNDRIESDGGKALFYNCPVREDGRIKGYTFDELRIQLCESADEELIDAEDLDYWYRGEFMTFEQIIALGEAQS